MEQAASAWTREGLRWLAQGRFGAERALECFDRALALRTTSPSADVPRQRFHLAGLWLNMASALRELGGDVREAAALDAHARAIDLLAPVAAGGTPSIVRRLAIAWQNRGLALQAQALHAPASADFRRALDLLDATDTRIMDRRLLRASILANLASSLAAHVGETAWREALEITATALDLVRDSETHDVQAAQVGLTARHVRCRALAACLESDAASPTVGSDVHAATDAADSGLALAARWQARGVTRFDRLADDLRHFGAQVYARYQPHFLAEFVAEHGRTGRPE